MYIVSLIQMPLVSSIHFHRCLVTLMHCRSLHQSISSDFIPLIKVLFLFKRVVLRFLGIIFISKFPVIFTILEMNEKRTLVALRKSFLVLIKTTCHLYSSVNVYEYCM